MKDFKGFEDPRMGFTQIPNEYLDYTISGECDLNSIELRIMNLFFRSTFGWHKQESTIIFSITDLQVILNVKNRNQIVDAMKKLSDTKEFLQKMLVSDLKKSERRNIERILNKTLKSNQILYRLNIKDNNSRWDNVHDIKAKMQNEIIEMKQVFEMPKPNQKYKRITSIKIGTGSNFDTGTSSNFDTGFGIKNDTSQDAETLDTLGEKESLKKGLKKDLKKEEEEEESNSELISYLLLKGIKLENALVFEKRLLEEKVVGYTNEDIVLAIAGSIEDFENGDCVEPYLWAVGKLKRIIDSKVVNLSPGQKKNKTRKSKSVRTEIEPEWLNESEEEKQKRLEQERSSVNIEEANRSIEESLAKLRGMSVEEFRVVKEKQKNTN